MARYTIAIDYTTGDSFGSERSTEHVGCSWADIDKAKEALRRIQAHYTAYRDGRREYTAEKKFIEAIRKEPWFWAEDGCELWKYGLLVEKDDGSTQQISAFWCGYFETLHAAEVVADEPEAHDMKVTF